MRPHLLVLAAVAGLYFVAGKAGLSLAYVNESTSAVWPPTGIAVAALLLFGLRTWPAIALGAFLVNVTTSGSEAASLAIAAGNTLEGLAAAWLVERFARGRASFERTADILRFACFALAATTIAATVGMAALVVAGLAPPAEAGSIWLTWWLGDAVGAVVVTPLLVLWHEPLRRRWTSPRAVEVVGLGGSVVAVALVIFGDSAAGALRLPIEFLTVPVLLWAAFRFGAWETAAAAAVLSVFALRGTMDGFGPFARSSPNESLILLLGFVGTITVVMLSVAAEVAARRTVESKMRILNQALEERVAVRTDELTRVHARLLEAQQVAHVGSWEWDVVENTLWWSEELCRIYGLIEGAPAAYDGFLARVYSDDRGMVQAAVAGALATCQPFSFDHRIVKPDGTVRVVHAHGRVIAGPDGRAIRMVGTGHDITERRAAEEQRAQLMIEQAARRDAEQASRAKDQFLATLSHELRTPLNVAHGWAHLLRRADAWDERSARAVETISRNLDMLSRLVSDIVDVSRITAGGFRLEISAVNISAVVDAAIETVRDMAAIRRITIDTRIEPSAPLLDGDPRRLQQVVWNLLSNAVKFARDDGRVTLTVTCESALEPFDPEQVERSRDDEVRIVVEDDGPGIAPAFLPHVFEEFQQADSSITREHGGLGLGLYIARHLVELHGGSITAGNRNAGGAIFTVHLPVESSPRLRDQESGPRAGLGLMP